MTIKTYEFFFIFEEDDYTTRVEAEDRADACNVLFEKLAKGWDGYLDGRDAEWFEAECSYITCTEIDLKEERRAKAAPVMLAALEFTAGWLEGVAERLRIDNMNPLACHLEVRRDTINKLIAKVKSCPNS